jgi:hypothetical protein
MSHPLSIKGQKEMDEAVALEPDNIGVRIPGSATLLTASRGIRSSEVARPMISKGLADCEHVFELQKNYVDKLGTHPKGELLFGIAEAVSRMGDTENATAFFERNGKEMPATECARRAAKWLSTRSLELSETTCVGCHVR